jgi:shikimate kinase
MKRISLVGFMGAGKSTMAKELAQLLELPVLDSDAWIEAHENQQISSIFQSKGEAYFRSIEAQFIDELTQYDQFVLATGGGMPCFGDNMNKINSLSVTIYLQHSPETLFNRLEKEVLKRPLLQEFNTDELKDFISKSVTIRERYYGQADIVVPTEQQDPFELVKRIKQLRKARNLD